MTGEIAAWGTHVQGCEEGHQWIKVGNCFLPVFVQGIRVISKCEEGSAEKEAKITFSNDKS